MIRRLLDVPVLEMRSDTIAAERYNRVRLALLRLGAPLRLSVPGLRGIDLLLDTDAWACVDRTLDDLPVVAWVDFEKHREGLHQPVACQLRYYHVYAGMIVKTAQEAMDQMLADRLAAH